MRSFISIEIPETIIKNVDGIIEKMKKCLTPIKWVENRNLHLTVKYLGTVDDDKLEMIEASLKESVKDIGEFEITLKGIGVFPSLQDAQVIWVGVDKGSDTFRHISDKVDSALSMFREEEHEFTPHLTIGRVKNKIDVGFLEGFIKELKDTDLGSFKVNSVSIFKSTLTQGGPIHEELKKVRLHG
jgi:RNA 2',3'-cyclic 3'-phosphodiesterase